MQKFTHIGCALAAIGLLVLALSCGAGVLAVQQRVVAAPRLNLQLGGYRLVTAPVTIRSRPPKYFYSVWLFATTYPPGSGLRTEKGEQILMLLLAE